ncbi:sensor histidine kinase [Kocuria tytonis]|uniref:sensor histidine kinase n=1 Tax=Kocuria tytonis TaxID=2054280 RepID=UPI001F1C03CA|nr:histidine kinase [Kocuria tytonis]
MSTAASNPTPPWDTTESLPTDTEHTRPLPPVNRPGTPADADAAPPTGSEHPSRSHASRPGGRQSAHRGTAGDSGPTGPGTTPGAPGTPGVPGPGTPGTAGPSDAPREWRMFSPKTLFFGGLDLVVDSVLNTALLSVVFAFLVAGAVTVPALGLGVLVLAATVYVMTAAVWLERRRAASSFGLDIRDPQRRRTPRTDWVRIPHQWWLDATDGPLWLGLLHLVLTCALGWLALVPFVVTGAAIATALAPAYMPAESVVRHALDSLRQVPEWALVPLGLAALLLSVLLGILLTLAHRGLSAGLLRQSEAVRLRREALESQRRAEYESAAKESAVRGAETERSRIERDLHDGVQPQLVSVAMNLSMAKSRIDTDPAAARELVAEAHGTTKAAITELRRLARGFHPAVLEDRGLDAALSAVAAQAPFPVDVSVTVPRLEPRTEAAVYFAVSESLTNAIKYSGTRSADVAVSLQDGPAPGTTVVVAGVRDFGRGGARVVPGGGLSGIQDRIRSAGGRFFVTSPVGGPTEVVVELPLTGGTTTAHGAYSAPGTVHARSSAPADDAPRGHGTDHGAGTAPGGPGQGTGGAASSYPAAGQSRPAAGEEN